MPRRQPGVTKYTTSDGRTFWHYVVDLGDDPDTGRRRQRRKRGFATQADASAALDEARRAIEAGGFLFDVEHMTFIEYLDHWLEGLPQTDMKPRTISDYRNETRRYIKPTSATSSSPSSRRCTSNASTAPSWPKAAGEGDRCRRRPCCGSIG